MATRLLERDQQNELTYPEAKARPVLPPPASGVQSLVRLLVRQVMDDIPSFTPLLEEEDAERVILDIEVDGLRCLLIRPQAAPFRAPMILSPREQEIARMVAKGYPNKAIAAVLDISTWTVCTHLRRIFAKLGVSSRAAMVAKVLESVRPERTASGGDASQHPMSAAAGVLRRARIGGESA